jgi:hypothetical protein
MPIVAKFDEWGQPAWIAVLILSFFFNWMLGLALLAFLIGSGRMGCGKWSGMSRWQGRAGAACHPGTWWQPKSSGNNAFDEYRAETLRRLEEEEQEFHEFLARLRAAKDKAEFDQFMADRRNRGGATGQATQS